MSSEYLSDSNAFLSEVARCELLAPEAQEALIQVVERGKQANRDLASADEPQVRKELTTAIAEAREAERQLVECNLRLVAVFARRFARRGVDFLDLMQEGSIALLRAVGRYDASRGMRFSTFASWRIRWAMYSAVQRYGRAIRLSPNAFDVLSKALRVERELVTELGRDPTSEEVASVVGVEASYLDALRRSAMSPTSLQAPVDRDDESGPVNDIGNDPHECVDMVVYERPLGIEARLRAAVCELDPMSSESLRMLYGLDGNPPRSRDDVAMALSMTAEAIEHLERRTITLLRGRLKRTQRRLLRTKNPGEPSL